jgi:DNA-binding SARP family transcriptional activator
MGGRSAVEVRVLGDLEVRIGGRKAALPASKKTRALLGYLVVTGLPQLREHLCELLWQGPDDPRGALRWSLTKLRAVVGERCIRADRERAEFVAEGVVCDMASVTRALTSGLRETPTDALREAAARFRGELLEGLDLPDCFRWHEWCAAQREAIRTLRVDILATLVERHAGEPEAALSYARQRLAIDPIAEAAHVAIVRLLTALGRNREASEQVESCRRILANELGTRPSAALLAARVREGAAGPTPSSPAHAPHEVASPPPAPVTPDPLVPFVGRGEELRMLHAAWQTAFVCGGGPGVGIVLVVGEPGIGKTRLIDELATGVAAGGACVLRGRAFEAEMVRPYGPWIDALRSIARTPEAAPYADSIAALSPEPGSVAEAPPVDRARVFDAVAGLLGSVAARAGCLVAFDDLQWFDDASLALLHFVVRAVSAARVLFACTARGDELAERAPAIRLVRAMQRDRRLSEIALGPLDPDATSAIARAVDGAADAARVAADSAGNPLFALELARAGSLGERGTPSLDALLADRLDRLDPRAQDVLPWAAALGRGFEAEVLSGLTGLEGIELLGALEELERRGVLRSESASHAERGGGYDFAHDLVRGAAYRRLSAPRRKFVHQRIARDLAQRAAVDPSLQGDVAHHAALAGDHELAARASVAAAERCLRMFAHDEAARIAESGLAHADRLPPASRIETRMSLLHAKILSGRWLRRARELSSDLARVIREARDAGMHGEVTRGLHALSVLQREQGDLSSAHDSTLRAMESARGGDQATRFRQLAQTGRCLALLERDIDRAREMVAEAAALEPAHDDDFDWCWADALLRSYFDEADAGPSLEHALTLARREEDRFGECECLILLVQRALDRGDPARALAWCRELSPVAAKMTEGIEGAIADALEAVARMASAVPGADTHVERTVSRLREVDAKGMLAYVLVTAAEMDRLAGRVERAQARADTALAAAEVVQRRTLVASACALLAELALARGDHADAAARLRSVAEDVASPAALSARVRARIQRVAARVKG